MPLRHDDDVLRPEWLRVVIRQHPIVFEDDAEFFGVR